MEVIPKKVLFFYVDANIGIICDLKLIFLFLLIHLTIKTLQNQSCMNALWLLMIMSVKSFADYTFVLFCFSFEY